MTTEEVRNAIIDYIADTGVAPTLRNVQERLGGSLSNVYRHVEILRAMNFLVNGRKNLSGQLWPTELIEIVRDSARYMTQHGDYRR